MSQDQSKETKPPPKSRRGRKPKTVPKELDFTGQNPVMIVEKAQKRRMTGKSRAINVGRQELAQMVGFITN